METGNITSKRTYGSQHGRGRGDTTKGIHSKTGIVLSDASSSAHFVHNTHLHPSVHPPPLVPDVLPDASVAPPIAYPLQQA